METSDSIPVCPSHTGVEQIHLGVPATGGSAEPVGGCLAVEGIPEVPPGGTLSRRTGLPGERDYGRAEWDTADASRAGRGELTEIGGNDRRDGKVVGAFAIV